MIGRNEKELTQAEYDALTEAQKNNGTVYFITDGQGGSGGSGTTYTVISDKTQTTNAWVNPIIFSCNPLDYDVIIFDITDSGDGRFYCITFPQTLPLDSGDGQNVRRYVLSNNFSCFPARLSNGMAMFTSTNVTLNVNKVTGIKFGGGGGGGSSEISYSTEERKIGTWIDGSDLYQRTFDLSTVQMNDNTWYNNILGTNGSGIVIQSWEGYFIAFGGIKVEYRYYRSSTEYMTSLMNSSNSDLSVRPNLSDSNPIYQGYITVRYTKEAS